jgi:hypothetical protein
VPVLLHSLLLLDQAKQLPHQLLALLQQQCCDGQVLLLLWLMLLTVC